MKHTVEKGSVEGNEQMMKSSSLMHHIPLSRSFVCRLISRKLPLLCSNVWCKAGGMVYDDLLAEDQMVVMGETILNDAIQEKMD